MKELSIFQYILFVAIIYSLTGVLLEYLLHGKIDFLSLTVKTIFFAPVFGLLMKKLSTKK